MTLARRTMDFLHCSTVKCVWRRREREKMIGCDNDDGFGSRETKHDGEYSNRTRRIAHIFIITVRTFSVVIILHHASATIERESE